MPHPRTTPPQNSSCLRQYSSRVKPQLSQDVPGGAHRIRRTGHGLLFSPGDPVRESGIYEVLHDAQHRTAHEVVMIANDRFPTCDTCAEKVRFRLVRTAPYIFADEDFEEPLD